MIYKHEGYTKEIQEEIELRKQCFLPSYKARASSKNEVKEALC